MKKGLDCRLFLVAIVGLWGAKGESDDDVTLTTAITFDATTPRPTVVYRRIPVDPHGQKIRRSPQDLFRLRTKQNSRRSNVDIWNWDYWCKLQSKAGNGTKVVQRYYYNTQIDQCSPFVYLGSKGNKNNFHTPGECDRYCKGSGYMWIKATVHRNLHCSLQADAGQCLGLFTNYFYDINEERCKTFLFGGCGGNQNRFHTLNDCMSQCHAEHDHITDPY